MADVEYKLEGIEELVEKSDKLSGEIGPIVKDLLTKSVLKVKRNAKKLAPVDTGRLRSSITHEIGPGHIPEWAQAGTNVLYAKHVEFGTRAHWAPFRAFEGWASRHGVSEAQVWWAVGTRGTKAKPFLMPGYEKAKPDIEKFTDEAKKAIEDTWA